MGIDIILLCCVSCAYNVYKYMSVYIWVVFIYITGFKSSSDCDNLSRVVINPPQQKKIKLLSPSMELRGLAWWRQRRIPLLLLYYPNLQLY